MQVHYVSKGENIPENSVSTASDIQTILILIVLQVHYQHIRSTSVTGYPVEGCLTLGQLLCGP